MNYPEDMIGAIKIKDGLFIGEPDNVAELFKKD